MDLELALGRDIGAMPERDFRRWQKYAMRKGLPARRSEFYLAQLAMLIAQTMGGSDAPLSAFLFDTKHDEKPQATVTDAEVEEMKKVLNFKPRKRNANG